MDEVRTSHRLCRPHFGDKSDKIEHKAALSQKWNFILQDGMWKDRYGKFHQIGSMSES